MTTGMTGKHGAHSGRKTVSRCIPLVYSKMISTRLAASPITLVSQILAESKAYYGRCGDYVIIVNLMR